MIPIQCINCRHDRLLTEWSYRGLPEVCNPKGISEHPSDYFHPATIGKQWYTLFHCSYPPKGNSKVLLTTKCHVYELGKFVRLVKRKRTPDESLTMLKIFSLPYQNHRLLTSHLYTSYCTTWTRKSGHPCLTWCTAPHRHRNRGHRTAKQSLPMRATDQRSNSRSFEMGQIEVHNQKYAKHIPLAGRG